MLHPGSALLRRVHTCSHTHTHTHTHTHPNTSCAKLDSVSCLTPSHRHHLAVHKLPMHGFAHCNLACHSMFARATYKAGHGHEWCQRARHQTVVVMLVRALATSKARELHTIMREQHCSQHGAPFLCGTTHSAHDPDSARVAACAHVQAVSVRHVPAEGGPSQLNFQSSVSPPPGLPPRHSLGHPTPAEVVSSLKAQAGRSGSSGSNPLQKHLQKHLPQLGKSLLGAFGGRAGTRDASGGGAGLGLGFKTGLGGGVTNHATLLNITTTCASCCATEVGWCLCGPPAMALARLPGSEHPCVRVGACGCVWVCVGVCGCVHAHARMRACMTCSTQVNARSVLPDVFHTHATGMGCKSECACQQVRVCVHLRACVCSMHTLQAIYETGPACRRGSALCLPDACCQPACKAGLKCFGATAHLIGREHGCLCLSNMQHVCRCAHSLWLGTHLAEPLALHAFG